jgi:serine/threonine protein phosphatase 1
MGYNIIGDIAGEYDALQQLLDKMPKDQEIISVGDMIDRGPKSKEVLDFFMNKGKAILGNHEHFLLTYQKTPPAESQKAYFEDSRIHYGSNYYDFKTREGVGDIWFGYNGGQATLDSFDGSIPDNVTEWIASLPLYIEMPGLFISHSPFNPNLTLEQNCDTKDFIMAGFLWNRGASRRMKDKFQVFGHNKRLKKHSDKKGDYAICIDNNGENEIIGLHWPSMEIFHQSY